MLKQSFQLGSLTLPSNIFCAPLAGCSDLPFRRMTTSYKPGLTYCEMVKMDALVRNDPSTYRLLDYEVGMHPIGAQLCGSRLHYAATSARIIESLGFDVVDLNCGCPVDKVTKDGSGSGMLKTPQLIGEMISNMVAAVKIPVTVKVRAGWDEDSINVAEITEIAEKAGAKAICVHGRTRAQGYKGPANWDWIQACKRAAKNILVIGNGDLFDADSAVRMFEHTKCDALLIARGTFGQPWIIEDIYRKLSGEEPLIRSFLYYKEALLTHLDHTLSYSNDHKAAMDMRRIGSWYLKQGKGTRKLRELLNRSKSIQDTRELIVNFAWEETDFSTPDTTGHTESESC
jgi:tRNA-dihydrouridine synthase B